MGSPAKGIVGIVLESQSNPGVQSLLPNTTIANSVTGYSQPSGSTGERIEIVVQQNPGTGTVTVAGTNPAGSNVNETTPNIGSAPTGGQSAELVAFKHLTAQVFASITSVTSSGLSSGGGLIRLGATQAEKFLLPCTMKYDDKRGEFSPNEFRQINARHTSISHLMIEASWDLEQVLYPDTGEWIYYLLFGPPASTATIPASPTALLAATTVAASMTLTTSPSAPGMKLIFTVTGSVAGTIVLQGTNWVGQAVNETVTVPGAGTYYSQNVYSAVNDGTANQFTTTGMTGGTLAVGGVFGFTKVWNDITNADSFYTACLNFYGGTDTRAYPFSIAEEADFDFDPSKEFKLSAKGRCQDAIPIGDRTVTPLSTNRLTTLAQPGDKPIMGWQSLVWIDPQYGTPGSTAYGTLLSGKVSIKTPRDITTPALNTQRFTNAYNKKEGREFSFEAKVDFRDLVQYEQFRKNLKQYLQLGAFGPWIGNSGGTSYQKSIQWVLPFKYDGDGDKPQPDPAKGYVEADYKGMCEYAPELGYSIQVTVTNHMPPTYAS